jgi:hypothetical protein
MWFFCHILRVWRRQKMLLQSILVGRETFTLKIYVASPRPNFVNHGPKRFTLVRAARAGGLTLSRSSADAAGCTIETGSA